MRWGQESTVVGIVMHYEARLWNRKGRELPCLSLNLSCHSAPLSFQFSTQRSRGVPGSEQVKHGICCRRTQSLAGRKGGHILNCNQSNMLYQRGSSDHCESLWQQDLPYPGELQKPPQEGTLQGRDLKDEWILIR